MVSFADKMKARNAATTPAAKSATSAKPAGKPTAGKPAAKVEVETGEEEATELAPKRGRGRPPGAKNKPKDEPAPTAAGKPAGASKPAGKPAAATGKPVQAGNTSRNSDLATEVAKMATQLEEMATAINSQIASLTTRVAALEGGTAAAAPSGKKGKAAKPEVAPTTVEERAAVHLAEFIDEAGELSITPEQVMELEITELLTLAELIQVDVTAHKTLAKKREAVAEALIAAESGEDAAAESGEEEVEAEPVTEAQLRNEKWWKKTIAAGKRPIVQVGDEQYFMEYSCLETDADGDVFAVFINEEAEEVCVYECGDNPSNEQGISLIGIA